jgi:hypothetical protein
MGNQSNNARSVYESIKTKYPNKTISQSYLRLDKNIQAVTGNGWTWDIIQGQGTPNTSERRLAQPDVFVATAVTMFIMKAGTSTSASNDDIAKAVPNTYVNSIRYSGVGEADNLQNLYNGALQFKINNNVVFPAIDTRRFYRVPTTQKGVGPAVIANADGYDATFYSYFGLTPNMEISGANTNEFSISLPASLALAGTTSTNYAILYFAGWLVQGGSVWNPQVR